MPLPVCATIVQLAPSHDALFTAGDRQANISRFLAKAQANNGNLSVISANLTPTYTNLTYLGYQLASVNQSLTETSQVLNYDRHLEEHMHELNDTIRANRNQLRQDLYRVDDIEYNAVENRHYLKQAVNNEVTRVLASRTLNDSGSLHSAMSAFAAK